MVPVPVSSPVVALSVTMPPPVPTNGVAPRTRTMVSSASCKVSGLRAIFTVPVVWPATTVNWSGAAGAV